MLVKMPAGQASKALNALGKMFTVEYPGKHSFAINRNLARLRNDPTVAACEMTRVGLIHKLGVQREDGNFTIPPNSAKLAEFIAEFQPVAETEVEIDVVPISTDALNFAPKMFPEEMGALDPFWEV